MIQFSAGFFFTSALLLLVLPLDWLCAVAVASVFHELCHILTLHVLGGRIHRIRIRANGCEIETDRIGEWRQFVCIFAGPMGSISLLSLCRAAPRIAICGLLQGLINLIPVFPLDGGRLLRLLLSFINPKWANQVMPAVAIGICIVLDCLAIWLWKRGSFSFWPLWAALVWNIRFLPRKIPCKPSENGVQ